jgi:ribonucleoside-diphosphate reductase alpha chain
MTIVNQTVPRALKALGYNRSQVEDIISYIDIEKTIVGAPHLKEEHLPVFACSMGDNAIHYTGHVKMMAAVQPFISGAISKTINMPEEVSVEEVEQMHMDAWKMGLKAVAVYRDNCKVAQPLAMAKKEGSEDKTPQAVTETVAELESLVPRGAMRRELPKIHNAKTFKFSVADSRGYFTVGEYEDGTPGELFISTAKMGSTLRGLMDAFAISISHGLQYGVPLKDYVRVFSHMSFAPSGITSDPDIRTASSLVDYIFRRIALTYLSFDDRLELGLATIDEMPDTQTTLLTDEDSDGEIVSHVTVETVEPIQRVESVSASTAPTPQISQEVKANDKPQASHTPDQAAPLCYNCGNQTQRAGSCYVCTACGSTTGCS